MYRYDQKQVPTSKWKQLFLINFWILFRILSVRYVLVVIHYLVITDDGN